MNRALLGLPLLFACGPIKSTPVTMTGHLLDNPSEDASPVGGATITVRDGNAEIFGEATSSDDGSFAVDVPAGAFFTVTSSADGYVPTSISGQAASGDFDAGDGNVVVFSVRDTGRGIPPQALLTLFEPFRRRQKQGEYAFSGAGLGLSICRKLVEAMRSTLQVETKGDGTRFYFVLDLPLARERT